MRKMIVLYFTMSSSVCLAKLAKLYKNEGLNFIRASACACILYYFTHELSNIPADYKSHRPPGVENLWPWHDKKIRSCRARFLYNRRIPGNRDSRSYRPILGFSGINNSEPNSEIVYLHSAWLIRIWFAGFFGEIFVSPRVAYGITQPVNFNYIYIGFLTYGLDFHSSVYSLNYEFWVSVELL